MREELIDERKSVFGSDSRRINHALSVLDYAERIQAVEGGDRDVVVAAAILHDIGIHEAERKYNSAAGNYHEIEGPPIAGKILDKFSFTNDRKEHICSIIANHHSAREIDTIEFRIVWDADWLVNIPDEFPDADREKLGRLIERVFKTAMGYQLAKDIFLENKT